MAVCSATVLLAIFSFGKGDLATTKRVAEDDELEHRPDTFLLSTGWHTASAPSNKTSKSAKKEALLEEEGNIIMASTTLVYVSDLKSWHDAEANCVAMGGHLVSVHNAADIDAIKALMTYGWIGGSETNRLWSWSDGTRWDYTRWNRGEPNYNVYNLADQMCTQHNPLPPTMWNDLQCYVSSQPSVCRIPLTASPTASPTAYPTASPTASPTALPTAYPTASPTASPTALPTAYPTASPTAPAWTMPTTVFGHWVDAGPRQFHDALSVYVEIT